MKNTWNKFNLYSVIELPLYIHCTSSRLLHKFYCEILAGKKCQMHSKHKSLSTLQVADYTLWSILLPEKKFSKCLYLLGCSMTEQFLLSAGSTSWMWSNQERKWSSETMSLKRVSYVSSCSNLNFHVLIELGFCKSQYFYCILS